MSPECRTKSQYKGSYNNTTFQNVANLNRPFGNGVGKVKVIREGVTNRLL